MKTKLDHLSPDALSSNPRASFAAWQRFEPIVVAAIRQHPRPLTHAPSSLSVATFVSRIRDAIRGKLAFDYPSEVSNVELTKWYGEIIVKSVGQLVYIGPKGAMDKAPLIYEALTHGSPDLVFSELSFDELAAFALLLSNGRITGPVIVRKPQDLSTLPQYPNFQILERPDGSVVLL